MNPLISIIVPVYNPGKYLRRCIESLINQTYSNIEVLLVDDGSSDGSDEICEEYKNSDSRISVIHQTNSGVSIARNRALDIAKGEYISFVDSDDYVTADFIESLYRAISENVVDLSICGLEKIGGINIKTGEYDDTYKSEKILLDYTGVIERDSLWFHSIDSNLIGGYLWNKLFKRCILDGSKLDSRLSIGEDMLFLVQYLLRIDKAYYIAKPMYKYQMNEQSALNNIDSTKKDVLVRKMESSMLATELIQKCTDNENGRIKNYVSYRRVRSSLWCMFRMINTNVYDKDLEREIKCTVKKNYNGYRSVGYGSKVQNIAVLIMRFSPSIMFVCGRIAMRLFPEKIYSYSRS